MLSLATLLLAAFLIDLFLGDPPYVLHPVRLLGHWATALEKLLRHSGLGGFFGGLVLAVVHPLSVLGVFLALHLALARLHPQIAFFFDIFVLYSSIAFRDLFDHLVPVRENLARGDLGGAREAVQRVVGRDAGRLDEKGVARAAVETVAEGLHDGAVGPIFWFATAGLIALEIPGLEAGGVAAFSTGAALLYRAYNTLDSMVGHRSERYLYFGRTSARCDDVLSYLPARGGVAALFLAAIFLRLDALRGLRTWWRDGGKHPSPNAGQTESFVAGALGVRLGGPTTYPYGTVDKAWLGDGKTDISGAEIALGCRLARGAGYVLVAVAAGILFFAESQIFREILT